MSEQTENISPQAEKNTPRKRSRLSLAEKVKRESEEVLKQMGSPIDIDGGRKTRSSTRGSSNKSTPATPPPTKKAKAATPSGSSSATKRGRPKKLDDTLTNDVSTPQKQEEIVAKKLPELKKSVETKESKNLSKLPENDNEETDKSVEKTPKLVINEKEAKEATPERTDEDKIDTEESCTSEKKGNEKMDVLNENAEVTKETNEDTEENMSSVSRELSNNSEKNLENKNEQLGSKSEKSNEDIHNVAEKKIDEVDIGEKLGTIREENSQEIRSAIEEVTKNKHIFGDDMEDKQLNSADQKIQKISADSEKQIENNLLTSDVIRNNQTLSEVSGKKNKNNEITSSNTMKGIESNELDCTSEKLTETIQETWGATGKKTEISKNVSGTNETSQVVCANKQNFEEKKGIAETLCYLEQEQILEKNRQTIVENQITDKEQRVEKQKNTSTEMTQYINSKSIIDGKSIIEETEKSPEIKQISNEKENNEKNQLTEEKSVEKSIEIEKGQNKDINSFEPMDIDDCPELPNNEVNNVEDASMPSTGANEYAELPNDVEMIEPNNDIGNSGISDESKIIKENDKRHDNISNVGENNVSHENYPVITTKRVDENTTDNTCDSKLSSVSEEVISAPQPCN